MKEFVLTVEVFKHWPIPILRIQQKESKEILKNKATEKGNFD